ncbi:hypothetical protein MNBD_GAMMA24-90 [hydrothermal vent metagenome]|uniref:Uncharacterized protein n=1 Tax=hydrothermal vent metagenome TaxID=652676 RepID=A0A3B1BFC5_9ZZZZ
MIDELYKRIRYYLFAPIPAERKNKPIKDRIRKVRYILFGHLPFLGRKPALGETSKAHGR